MVQINEHLRATAKPSERHSAGNSTVAASHQPVQAVSAIVFEQEFFDELITTNQPQVESSVHSMDENHTDDSDSTLESISDAEANSQKNSSDGPRYSFSTEIPETYDDFYLCVLPRDPKMLYVYWELPDGTRSEEHTFQEHAPTKEQLVLRVNGHTVDNNVTHVNSSYDIPLQSNAADSYIHVPTGASQCSVECGIVNEWGNFRPYTPPDYKYNQSIEMVDLHNDEKFEYIIGSLWKTEYRLHRLVLAHRLWNLLLKRIVLMITITAMMYLSGGLICRLSSLTQHTILEAPHQFKLSIVVHEKPNRA